MKTISIFLVAIVSLIHANVASASPDPELLKSVLEATPRCQNDVRFDDNNIYLGFGAYRLGVEEPRKPIPASLRVIPLAKPSAAFNLSTKDAAIDSVTMGNSIFILTYSGIEEWDLPTRMPKTIYPTYSFAGTMAYMQHAQGFARYGNKMIIAHGRLGVSFFDLETKQITNQFHLFDNQLPLESAATAVTVSGNLAYVVVEGLSLVDVGRQPFSGIVVIDMDQEKVVSEIGGLDPGADAIVSDGSKLIVSFSGLPIWKYGLNQIVGTKLPTPEKNIWHFPLSGNPTGSPAMDEKYYYSCFLKPGANGYFIPSPMALDRKQLQLD